MLIVAENRSSGLQRERMASSGVLQPARPVMQIERIDHLNITVADIDRSIESYERVLGMRAERMGEGRAGLLFGQQKIHLDLAGSTAMSGQNACRRISAS